MAELTITQENFNETVLQADKPVLLDFWATWCGPCQMLAPTVAELAREQEGAVVVGKVNVDEQPELAHQFGIVSIPTVVVLKDGREVQRAVGLRPKEQLEALLK